MSLLDTASLLLTPNAYKEGKLYSVIPSDGNGDFTFTRATTATRVNSDGLVELVPYNLLTYSEDFANGNWVKNEATISSNIATAPNGTTTADKLIENTANDSHHVYQNATANGVNTFSFYAKKGERTFVYAYADSVGQGKCFNLTSGTLGVNIISAPINATIESVGNDWFRCTITVSITSASALRIGLCSADGTFSYLGNGTSGAYIWGAQLVEGTNALPYQKTETRLNIPRLDYSLGGCPNILLEPQRTNLALQSSSFDNASWVKQGTSIVSNSINSPSGILNADSIIDNTTNTRHVIVQPITGDLSISRAMSLYAKQNTLRYLYMSVTNAGDSHCYSAIFDLQSGTVSATKVNGSATINASIQSVGNGWYRCTITGTMTSGTATFYPLIGTSDREGFTGTLVNNNAPSYAGSGQSLYIWGAQLEAGAYATSYIPTTTASVTRNFDQLSLSNIFANGLITASGGTWFVDFRNNVPLTRDSVVRFGLGDNSAISLNSIYFIGGASNERLIIQKRVAGVTTTLYTTTADTCKIAFKWNGATMDIFENGFKVIADSVFTSTDLNFFNGINANPSRFINQMALFPTPLTDDECTQLTTI